LGGFFYSLVVLRPGLDQKNLEREEISKIAKSLEIQAHTDPLTGAFNRRYFENSLEAYLDEFAKMGSEMGLILIDLDHFKNVNDQYGHDVGDRVLIEVALRLKQTAREYDVVARIGGEEFAIIAPCVTKSDLEKVANRFREMVAKLSVTAGSVLIRPTASIGVATTAEDGDNSSDLYKAADKRLYKAKLTGRNKVVA